MEKFLKGRGLNDEEVQKMKTDKVDEEVVLLMSDYELSQYVAKYGDRIALLAYLKSSDGENKSQEENRKNHIVEDILDGLNFRCVSNKRKKGMDEHNNRSLQQQGNRNATKRSRRVEIGWLNFDESENEYRQIKTPKGGGVRHYVMEASATMESVLNDAKKVFFDKAGQSIQGQIDSFDFLVMDSNRSILDRTCTVSEMYQQTKVKILRIYMCTKKKRLANTLNEDSDHDDGGRNNEDFETTDTPTIYFRKTKPGQSENKENNNDFLNRNSRCLLTFDDNGGGTTSAVSLGQSSSASAVPAIIVDESITDLDHTRGKDQSQPDFCTDESITDLDHTRGKSQSQPDFCTDESITDLDHTRGKDQSQPDFCTDDLQLLCNNKTEEVDIWEVDVDIGPTDLTMEGILRWWHRRTLLQGAEQREILVCRFDLLRSTLRVIRRESFNFCSPFKVTFSGEDGDDLGGPKREFLRMLMTEVSASVFQGNEDGKFFNHDLEKLSKGSYEMAGRLVAFSILHGGPGIPILHPLVYEMIVHGELREEMELPTIENCIFDLEIRQKLNVLQNAANQLEYKKSLDDIDEWCLENSLSLTNFKDFSQKERLLAILKRNEIFYRVQSEIVQFRNGLNKLGGFLEAIQLSPSEMRPLFVFSGRSLSFREIRALYIVQWSTEGSNDRAKEQRALYCLEAFLADCDEGANDVKLEEVLSFWTGATVIPPLGFDKDLEVAFSNSKQLPTAHTCGLILRIWRGFEDPDEFAMTISKAIKWAGGFHLV